MVSVAVTVVVIAVDEVDDRHDLEEDIQRNVIEVERDSERNTDADRGTTVVALPQVAILEVPVPEARPDVDRQLEGRCRHERGRVPEIVRIHVEAITVVVVLVDPAEAEIERTGLRHEVLAAQAGRLAELETETKRLVGLEALMRATGTA